MIWSLLPGVMAVFAGLLAALLLLGALSSEASRGSWAALLGPLTPRLPAGLQARLAARRPPARPVMAVFGMTALAGMIAPELWLSVSGFALVMFGLWAARAAVSADPPARRAAWGLALRRLMLGALSLAAALMLMGVRAARPAPVIERLPGNPALEFPAPLEEPLAPEVEAPPGL